MVRFWSPVSLFVATRFCLVRMSALDLWIRKFDSLVAIRQEDATAIEEGSTRTSSHPLAPSPLFLSGCIIKSIQ